MEPGAPGSSSLLGSLRGLADGVLRSAHDRVELFGLELQEEKLRLVQWVAWISAIVFLGMLATVFLSLALVIAFWDTAKVAVIVGLAAAYSALFAATVVAFRSYLKRQPKPFAATLQELRQDRSWVQDAS